MTASVALLVLSVACGAGAAASAVMMTRWLDQRGLGTPFPLMGVLVLRNLGRYREITLRETGRVGPLFYLYVVPMNAALILFVVAAVTGTLG